MKPRDLFDMGSEELLDDTSEEVSDDVSNLCPINVQNIDDTEDPTWVRLDVEEDIVAPVIRAHESVSALC